MSQLIESSQRFTSQNEEKLYLRQLSIVKTVKVTSQPYKSSSSVSAFRRPNSKLLLNNNKNYVRKTNAKNHSNLRTKFTVLRTNSQSTNISFVDTKQMAISKSKFKQITREFITKLHGSPMRVSNEAFEMLHSAVESFTSELFRKSLKAAYHAKRATVMVQDLQLVQGVQKPVVNCTA